MFEMEHLWLFQETWDTVESNKNGHHRWLNVIKDITDVSLHKHNQEQLILHWMR